MTHNQVDSALELLQEHRLVISKELVKPEYDRINTRGYVDLVRAADESQGKAFDQAVTTAYLQYHQDDPIFGELLQFLEEGE